MVKSIRARLDSDGGFTLIELLVVMIIISILMAVAVPVFLGQKQKALATGAKTNAKNVQDTIEGCAAGTVTGTLIQTGANALDCTLPATLIALEPSLQNILTGTSCGGAACVVVSGGSANGYTLTSITNSPAADRGTFTLVRSASTVVKSCTGASVNVTQRMCGSGTW